MLDGEEWSPNARDDILVVRTNDPANDPTLDAVLQRISENLGTIKFDKTEFQVAELHFIGSRCRRLD